jgi:hypothetical protein
VADGGCSASDPGEQAESGDDRTYWCGVRSVIFDGGTRLVYFEYPDDPQPPTARDTTQPSKGTNRS